MISSPHAHTLPPSRHTPFVKYYLSRWFSIFQWLTGTRIWSAIFQCCEEGTCRALLNMAGENTLISHTFYTQNVSFSIYAAIFALWVTFCVCPVSCCPSGCFKAWREHYCLSYCTVLSSLSFCDTVPVKKKEGKKEKHHIAAGIFIHVFHWLHSNELGSVSHCSSWALTV